MHLLSWITVLCLMTIGCGGGGGGGTPGLTFSGLNTPAVITADNAEAIAASAFDAGSNGAAFTGIAALDEAEPMADEPGRFLLAGIARVIEGAFGKMDFIAASEQDVSAAVQSESGSIDGACGGSASYSIQFNTDSGSFSGSLTFNGFCEDGMSLSGQTTYSGFVNTSTDQLESFTLSFDSVSSTSTSASITMSGQIQLTISGSSLLAIMDMLIRDDTLLLVYKVENYQMTITDMPGSTEIQISGRFYDPDYGYVDLDTPSSFLIRDTDEYPYSGILVLAGAAGTAGGPTRARLTVISEIDCQVEADTNGDGAYDYLSGPILWADL